MGIVFQVERGRQVPLLGRRRGRAGQVERGGGEEGGDGAEVGRRRRGGPRRGRDHRGAAGGRHGALVRHAAQDTGTEFGNTSDEFAA